MDAKTFGKYLKSLRKKKGLTLTELGNLIGYSNPYLSQIENGKKGIPSPNLLKKLSEPLGVSSETLMIKAGYLTEHNGFTGLLKGKDGIKIFRDGIEITDEDEKNREIIRYQQLFINSFVKNGEKLKKEKESKKDKD